jgi:hypothetical protein
MYVSAPCRSNNNSEYPTEFASPRIINFVNLVARPDINIGQLTWMSINIGIFATRNYSPAHCTLDIEFISFGACARSPYTLIDYTIYLAIDELQ